MVYGEGLKVGGCVCVCTVAVQGNVYVCVCVCVCEHRVICKQMRFGCELCARVLHSGMA